MTFSIRSPKMEGNKYCGPAVVSSILGVTSGEAARLIRLQTGKRMVKGTRVSELITTLAAYNVTLAPVPLPRPSGKRLTLAAWLRNRNRDSKQLYVVLAGNHYQLVQGRRFTCGIVKEIVSIKHPKVKRRASVAKVFAVIANGPVRLPEVQKRKGNPLRAKCRYLARKINCVIERDDCGLWVFGPAEVYGDHARDDPMEGDHCCCGWGEVMHALLTYQKDLAKIG